MEDEDGDEWLDNDEGCMFGEDEGSRLPVMKGLVFISKLP